MAYTNVSRLPGDVNGVAEPLKQGLTWHYFQLHNFDTELDTTSIKLSALIKLGDSSKNVFKDRTHVKITNTHATQDIYVMEGGTVSSTVYSHKIAAGGVLLEAWSADIDIVLIGSNTNTTCTVVELG